MTTMHHQHLRWPLLMSVVLASSFAIASMGCRQGTVGPSPNTSTDTLDSMLELVSKEVLRNGDDKTTFKFSFRCRKPADRNYRILFHGYVKDENLIPPDKRNPYKFINCSHNFKQRPEKWVPGEIIHHDITLSLRPGEYNFHFGLYDRHTSKAIPGRIELGWMYLPPR